jgi:hypothetical protein
VHEQLCSLFSSLPNHVLTLALTLWAAQVVAKYGGLDSIVEWSTMLSLGEQQRLAFARLLLARPSLALLDESTRYVVKIRPIRFVCLAESLSGELPDCARHPSSALARPRARGLPAEARSWSYHHEWHEADQS